MTSPRSYYVRRLAGERLRQCYAVAPPRVRRYLRAEIDHVLAAMDPSDRVLELGCGYGRVLRALAAGARYVLGVDLSRESLALARAEGVPADLAQMDALALACREASFDLVVCVQNGAAVVGGDPEALLKEATRVTAPGGRVLVSSYAEGFWEERLRWFAIQAARGLVGPIDEAATGRGTIVCRDGFRATTVTPEEFRTLAARLGCPARITEVDGSSVFCELRAAARP